MVTVKQAISRHCILILALLFASAELALAQAGSDVHQHSTTPINARYEVVQSELAAKWTFRLDRFTGRVSQLVKTAGGDTTWSAMDVLALPDIDKASRPRFQIFASGIAAQHTFLIDTDSGKTWLLVTNTETAPDGTTSETNLWQPFSS
jgi:hypothetical protein